MRNNGIYHLDCAINNNKMLSVVSVKVILDCDVASEVSVRLRCFVVFEL